MVGRGTHTGSYLAGLLAQMMKELEQVPFKKASSCEVAG